MFGFIAGSIKKEFSHIRTGLGSFSSDPIGGIGALVSLLTFIAAVATFVILMVQFVTGNGYDDIFADLLSIKGNAASFYGFPYVIILGSLNIVMLVISYILYFKNENWGFRILGIIPFIVVIAGFVSYAYFLQQYKMEKLADKSAAVDLVKALMVAGMIAIVLSIVLLLIREKDMSRSCLRMLILSFGILPLLTLAAQNIGLLAVLAVVLIVLAIVFAVNKGSSDSKSYTPSNSPAATKPAAPSVSSSDQSRIIDDINRRYKEGTAAIVRRHNEVGAFAFSDATNAEIRQLRAELEREAEAKGVKGKVSIY